MTSWMPLHEDESIPCTWRWIGTTCPGEHRENCGCPGTDSFRHFPGCNCFPRGDDGAPQGV